MLVERLQNERLVFLTEKIIISDHGRIFRLVENEWIESADNALSVNRRGAHRSVWVLETFSNLRPDDGQRYVCCHKDDDRLNNHIDNLYWGTRGDNVRDAFRNRHLRPKIIDEDIPTMISLYNNGTSMREIGDIYNVSGAAVAGRLKGLVVARVGHPRFRLDENDKDAIEMKQLFKEGVSLTDIAAIFAVCPATVKRRLKA